MFEDVRFYFPNEQIYSQIQIFKVLDIFNHDHLNIKQSYRRHLREKKQKVLEEQEKERRYANWDANRSLEASELAYHEARKVQANLLSPKIFGT